MINVFIKTEYWTVQVAKLKMKLALCPLTTIKYVTVSLFDTSLTPVVSIYKNVSLLSMLPVCHTSKKQAY